MHELVVIPSFQRELVLGETLKALRKVEPNIEVHLFSDRGYYGPDLGRLAWEYNANLHIIPQHKQRGNAHIIKEIMKWLITKQSAISYLVESDVLIGPDFFVWARQNVDSVFSCCGWSAPTGLNQQCFLQYMSGVTAALPLRSVALIAEGIKSNRQRPWDLQVTDMLHGTDQFCLYPAERLVEHVGVIGTNFNLGSHKGDTGFADAYIPVKGLKKRRKPVLEEGIWKMR